MARSPNMDVLRLAPIGTVLQKWCKKHNDGEGAWLDAEHLMASRKYAGGLHLQCRECHGKARLEAEHRHPDKRIERVRRWKDNNPDKVELDWRKQNEAR